MKIFKLIFLISLFILKVKCKINTFNNGIIQTCLNINLCYFDDASIWENNQIPQNGDSFIIDFSSITNYTKITNIYISTRNQLSNNGSFINITITGGENVIPNFNFLNTNFSFQTFQIKNSNIKFENTVGYNYPNIKIANSWKVINSTINGIGTSLISNNVNVDYYSSFIFQSQSNVTIDGKINFGTQPKLLNSIFSILNNDDNKNQIIFNQGIKSDSLVIMDKATIIGISEIENLILYGTIELISATVTINNNISFISNDQKGQSQLNIGVDSQITIDCNNVVIDSPYIAKGSQLTIQQPNVTIIGASGSGIVYFEIVGDNKNNLTSYFKDSTSLDDIDIWYSGNINLIISNNFIGNIIEIRSVNDNSNKSITFTNNNIIESISSSNTNIIVTGENSLLRIDGENSQVLNHDIYIDGGTLFLNNTIINLSENNYITILNNNDKLIIDNSNINGNVLLDDGQIETFRKSTISNNVLVYSQGEIFFIGQSSGVLNISGDLELYGSLYFDKIDHPFDTPQLIINGMVSFNQNSTLSINFLNGPNKFQQYNLIRSSIFKNSTTTITTGNPFSNVHFYKNNESFSDTIYSILVKNNFISLDFGSDYIHNKKEIPGWAIFLIIFGGVTIISSALFYVYYYRRRVDELKNQS